MFSLRSFSVVKKKSLYKLFLGLPINFIADSLLSYAVMMLLIAFN